MWLQAIEKPYGSHGGLCVSQMLCVPVYGWVCSREENDDG